MKKRSALLLLAALIGTTIAFNPASAFPPSSPPDLHGGPTDFFVTSDNTSIAMDVIYPADYDPAHPSAKKYPAILEMAGYENGSADKDGRTTTGQLDDWCRTQIDPHCTGAPLTGDSEAGTSSYHYADYVRVHASVRGTGCSAGEFDLFSTRSAQDGYEIIENYIAKAPWSSGKVAILGHSYSGLTGTMIAGQEGLAKAEGRSHHLTVLNVSGLIDDLYRGITYPGGIFNGLFPPEWTLAVRPAYDIAGGTAQGIVRNLQSHPEIAQQCAANVATHRRAVLNDPVLQGTNGFDNDWFRSRSLYTYTHLIDVPTVITGGFNDEQTGARGPSHVWQLIPAKYKRLILTNGNHDTNVDAFETWAQRKAFTDHFMNPNSPLSVGFDYEETPISVRTLFELHHDTSGALVPNGVRESTSFPIADTTWTPYYFCSGKTLQTSLTGCGPGSDLYLSATKRQSWSYESPNNSDGSQVTTPEGPDELDLRGPIVAAGKDVAIDGPITANLYLSTTANDTQLFVQVADEDTVNHTISFLQRGMLKASQAAIDPLKSDYDGSYLYRPYRPHTSEVNLVPGDKNDFLVEVWPVAHVFRPGHRLLVKIMDPPMTDSQYAYLPHEIPAAVNTVFYADASHPSRITLPVIPFDFTLGPELACGQYWQVRCVNE